jgi:hypothetical protein
VPSSAVTTTSIVPPSDALTLVAEPEVAEVPLIATVARSSLVVGVRSTLFTPLSLLRATFRSYVVVSAAKDGSRKPGEFSRLASVASELKGYRTVTAYWVSE